MPTKYFFSKLKSVSQKITYRQLILSLVLVMVLIVLAIYSWPDANLHIYFFDVGQGDSIFIHTPGDYKILVDGGPDQAVLERLSSVLPYYDREIDLMMLTHPHADHVNGLNEVLDKYEVRKVIYNPIPYGSSEYKRFKDRVQEMAIPVEMFTQGQKIELPDGVTLDCFWPLKQETLAEYEDVNQASIVLRIEYGKFSALLTGDAEFEEIYQLAVYDWLPVQALKVPHQGSRGAVTESVLDKLQPELAIITVGENNFGHPVSSEIIKLEAAGAKVLRTDHHGTVEVVSDGKKWYYRSERWK